MQNVLTHESLLPRKPGFIDLAKCLDLIDCRHKQLDLLKVSALAFSLMKHQLNRGVFWNWPQGNTDAEHQIAEAPRFRNASALKLRGVNERQFTTQKGPLQEQ
jgi:hypothetical protein